MTASGYGVTYDDFREHMTYAEWTALHEFNALAQRNGTPYKTPAEYIAERDAAKKAAEDWAKIREDSTGGTITDPKPPIEPVSEETESMRREADHTQGPDGPQ